MGANEEKGRNGCTCRGIFNFSSAIPPVWMSATQTARKQEALCAVCYSGVGKRDKRWKVSRVMQRMQQNSRILAILIAKEILVFSSSDSVPRQQEKGVHPAKLRWAGEAMRTWEAALFPWDYSSPQPELSSTSQQTLPEPEILSESTQELLPPINAFQWIPIKGGGQKIISSMNGAFSDLWPRALRWKRNCSLLPWLWKGAHRFFSPASRSICPAQVKDISIMTNTSHRTAGGYKLSLSAHNPTKSCFVAYQTSQKMQYHYAEKHEVAFCKWKLLKWISKQCFCQLHLRLCAS